MKTLKVCLFTFTLGWFNYILFSCNQSDRGQLADENNSAYIKNDIFQKGSNTLIKIDVSTGSSVKFSELFSDVKYTILDSPKGLIIGAVKKVVEADNLFFIKSNGKIYIHDVNGKYKAKIDQQGEGPGQYRAITDFSIDTTSHRVLLLDNHSFSMFEFDYEGKLITNWKHGVLCFQFQKLSENNYLFYSDKELASSFTGRFLLFNRVKNKVVENYVPIDRRRIKYESFLDVNNFFVNGKETLISCSGNDTIFSLVDNKIEAKYTLSFGSDGVPDDFYEKHLETVVEFNNSRLKNDFAGLYYTSFGENDRNLICQIVKGRNVYYLWYDKKEKKYLLINRFNDDMVFKGTRTTVGSTFPTFFGKHRALRVVEPEVILNKLDSIQKASSVDEWQSLLADNQQIKLLREKVKLSSNPVMQIMTYK